MTELQRKLLCDPQTSGGLLLAVLPEAMDEVKAIARCHGIELTAIGELSEQQSGRVLIEVNE